MVKRNEYNVTRPSHESGGDSRDLQILRQLETIIGKRIYCMEEFNGESLGYRIQDDRITGIVIRRQCLELIPKILWELTALEYLVTLLPGRPRSISQ